MFDKMWKISALVIPLEYKVCFPTIKGMRCFDIENASVIKYVHHLQMKAHLETIECKIDLRTWCTIWSCIHVLSITWALCKMEYIPPLFKGCKANSGNYRPLSLASVVESIWCGFCQTGFTGIRKDKDWLRIVRIALCMGNLDSKIRYQRGLMSTGCRCWLETM